MRDGLIVSVLSLVPRKATSRWMGWIARWAPSRLLVRLFVRAYGVDLDEAEHPLAAYPTLDAFFTRRLRPGARPVDPTPDVLVSPVDGELAWAGTTHDGTFDMAPGRPCSLAELLGETPDGPRDVVVLYLSPRDYHRVHAPMDLVLRSWAYLPGTLWPVFASAVRAVDGLFARNERVVLRGEAGGDAVALVMVGAFGVGRIGIAGVDLPDRAAVGGVPAPAARARGEEVGTFHLGSTVVLVLPAGRWALPTRFGTKVRMGSRLGD